MGVFYPSAAMALRVRWENFGNEDDKLLNELTNLIVQPRELSVTINDYTEADRFRASIDYKEFPYDPRSIRALGASIFIQDMRAMFKDGELNRIEPQAGRDGNVVFIGFADVETLDFDDTMRAVTFEGRDLTSLFIDAPFEERLLNLNKPLDQVIQSLVRELKATENIAVVNRTGSSLPSLGKFAEDLGVDAGQRNTDRRERYWDVIQDLARRAGLIAYMDLDELVLTEPRALYRKNEAKHFIYGKNLSRLTFRRKIGRVQRFNVAVRSMIQTTKEVKTVIIPQDASVEFERRTGIPRETVLDIKFDKDGKLVTDDDAEPAPLFTFLLPNIKDVNHLRSVGERIFEELGRQEIEGEMETKDMTVGFGTQDSPVEFDVTKLRVGEPLKVELEDEQELNRLRGASSTSEKIAYLLERGYDPQIARVLAEALSRFNNVFYTRAVEFNLTEDGGFSCRLEFVNFIELPESLRTQRAQAGGVN